MNEKRCETVADYLGVLEREPEEHDALLGSMLIKVTSFFRDPELWDALSTKVVPELLAEKRPGEEVRVWCAGCATGEEAFSIAILLAEAMGPAFAHQDVKVFGTDVDEKAIAFARRGVYGMDRLENVSPAMLKEWFVAEEGGYAVRKDIRRRVVFGINNLVSDAPISRLDLLLCRNVFIYLDANLQKRVLTRFHYALRRKGVLVLGKSELVPFAGRIYDLIDLARRVYRKDGRGGANVQQERLAGLLEQESAVRGAEPAELSAPDQFHREVLQAIDIPVIATGLDGTVMLWNQAATNFWGRRESDVVGGRLDALKLPGLSGEVLLEKSSLVRDGKSERQTGGGVWSRAGEIRPLQLSVDVLPLRDATRQPTGLVYLVRDVSATHDLEADLRKATSDRQAAYEELQTINEELQSSNEELETTNEELQSANEELQTTNEELQSTNEELETTNEELQSTNAELDATNRELAHRTDELNRLTYFQRTIIRTLSSAVLVLDAAGRVTVWNLAAERLLGLTEGEAVGQVLWTLAVPALARGVLQKLRKSLMQGLALRNDLVAYELPTGGQGKAALSAVAITDGGAMVGAVIIFEDVTRAALMATQDVRRRNGEAPKRRR